MPDVREKLAELIAQKVCDVWSEACDERIPPDCGKCYANTCRIAEVADHLIANGVTIQRWIPVTERLPEKSGKYLCIARSSLFRDATFQAILGYDKGGFHDGCICMDDVTHWMPLPEPPKGE